MTEWWTVLGAVAVAYCSVLPSSLSAQDSPSYLPRALHSTFDSWSKKPTHRAFALSRSGAWGSAYGHPSMASARKDALSNCTSYADDCVIIAENETIVQQTNPFPASSEDDPLLERLQHLSDGTVFLLAIAALALLAIGTVTAERYPLFLFDTGLSDIWRLRMNYTLLPFGFLYFVLMLPLFFRLGEGNFSNPLTWVVFGAPILPYVGVVLYLRQKGKLSKRFKIE